MKTDFDREMDSLLRAQARRDSAALTEPGGASSLPLQDGRASAAQLSAHLDADELNAYAENALPVSTRTLYAAHLADCVQCRHLVTRLAFAAGTPAQLEQSVATKTGSAPLKVSWQARIGALLSARAWRYAVPMLALLLISAIGLLSLLRPAPNERSIAESVAPPLSKPDRAAQPKLSDEEQHSDAPATANSNKAVAAQNSSVPAVKGEVAAKEEVAANDARPAVARPRTDTMVSNTAPAPSGSATVTGAPVVALPPPQPTPAPIAEATGITAEREAKTAPSTHDQLASAANMRNVESEQREGTNDARRSARTRSGRAANANNSRSDARVTDESLTSTPSAPAAPRAAAKPQGAARGGENTSDAAGGGSAQKDESPRAQAAAETRSIANRKFRRQGRAWVDTAYSSTQAVTIVRRNSEQYRALVADEPELRRIADALGGEVTVVWKGRAYRIR